MTAPVAWLPSRGLLAAAQKEPCAIAFVEPETGRVVRALPAGRFVVALAFSPDERRMAVSNESGLSIRDAETGADLVVPSGQEDLQLSDRASLRSPRAAQTGASKMAALVERGAPRDFRDIYTMREGIEAIGIRELAGMLAS
jgi:dipeptidyl aminopeptidase/acylaminoacyl peptidase